MSLLVSTMQAIPSQLRSTSEQVYGSQCCSLGAGRGTHRQLSSYTELSSPTAQSSRGRHGQLGSLAGRRQAPVCRPCPVGSSGCCFLSDAAQQGHGPRVDGPPLHSLLATTRGGVRGPWAHRSRHSVGWLLPEVRAPPWRWRGTVRPLPHPLPHPPIDRGRRLPLPALSPRTALPHPPPFPAHPTTTLPRRTPPSIHPAWPPRLPDLGGPPRRLSHRQPPPPWRGAAGRRRPAATRRV